MKKINRRTKVIIFTIMIGVIIIGAYIAGILIPDAAHRGLEIACGPELLTLLTAPRLRELALALARDLVEHHRVRHAGFRGDAHGVHLALHAAGKLRDDPGGLL